MRESVLSVSKEDNGYNCGVCIGISYQYATGMNTAVSHAAVAECFLFGAKTYTRTVQHVDRPRGLRGTAAFFSIQENESSLYSAVGVAIFGLTLMFVASIVRLSSPSDDLAVGLILLRVYFIRIFQGRLP